MGTVILPSTQISALTPICNDCGIVLCWDISEIEYQEAKEFWDNWTCEECTPNYRPGSLKRFKQRRHDDQATQNSPN